MSANKARDVKCGLCEESRGDSSFHRIARNPRRLKTGGETPRPPQVCRRARLSRAQLPYESTHLRWSRRLDAPHSTMCKNDAQCKNIVVGASTNRKRFVNAPTVLHVKKRGGEHIRRSHTKAFLYCKKDLCAQHRRHCARFKRFKAFYRNMKLACHADKRKPFLFA